MGCISGVQRGLLSAVRQVGIGSTWSTRPSTARLRSSWRGRTEDKGLLDLALFHRGGSATGRSDGELILLGQDAARNLAEIKRANRCWTCGPQPSRSFDQLQRDRGTTPTRTRPKPIRIVTGTGPVQTDLPVIRLNHAVAVAMADGPDRGSPGDASRPAAYTFLPRRGELLRDRRRAEAVESLTGPGGASVRAGHIVAVPPPPFNARMSRRGRSGRRPRVPEGDA